MLGPTTEAIVFLAHDLGTTGDKATLYDAEGTLLGAVTVPYPTEYGAGGRVEQEPERWWDAVAQATRQLLDRTGLPAADVESVSFSGQMMGAVLLDAEGEPVRPALIWADTRSVRQCEQLLERVGMARGYELTGHRLNPTYSLTKAMWVRDEEPGAWERTAAICQAKDLIAYRLTGRLVTDPSDASSTNAFEQRSGRWSLELLEAAGIEPALLPEVVPSTTVVGEVTAAAAEHTGLLAGTPVVIGGGDGPCGATGAGRIGPEDGAYCYLGSSSWISLAADAPLLDASMRSMTFNHVVPDRYVPTATMQAGGASLEWIADVLEPAGGSDRWERLLADVATTAAADEGLLFLPHLLGERSPYWDPHARGAFIGLSKHHGPSALVRAVMEGVAMNLRTCVQAFEEQGAEIGPVDAIGGGARSGIWLQICADVWGVEVRQRSLVEEATSLGAAVIGGVGVGALPGFGIARTYSDLEQTFEPDAEAHERYAARHEQFLTAYRQLEPLFADL
jgi:xylulokinase